MDVDVIARVISNGGVVCMRSDTVYGLMASAKDPEAVKRQFEIKGREANPGTFIAASIRQLTSLGLDSSDLQRAEKFWPGPNSVIIDAPTKLKYLHMGMGSLAVRIPDDKKLITLLEATGPLSTTSANLPGQPTSEDITQAQKIFGDSVDLYVDGGRVKNTPPSSIYRISDGVITQIR